ncbi:CoB--CoM heterodisulfide reductase iron-sulfur subunit A family protein [Desulfovibrio ferrophilus]|uniref:Heterodisulfide reductase subunit A n=1 Tax=Desulfovibrio ferrophilus TaxID=241368 RepID=A0A2Z6B008_9BACT|nr:FAD-dependent oxidoreductase [Desulfovibrio ferrophilus]BBD08783.1 heterodisulfide reductase subunit A [Desulfovibrio ferrophilus]
MPNTSVLVVGGGFSGITAALEAAEVGHEVFLVEKSPYLGGRVAQLNKYFPKLCPPSCGLEIQFQRIKKNSLVNVFTLAEVVSVTGQKGDYTVKIKIKPRFTAPFAADLSEAADEIGSGSVNEFEFGLAQRKALHKDMPFAYPARYVLEKDELSSSDAEKLAENEFIDLDETEKVIEVNVGAIVMATGWKPYDMTNLTNLGAGLIENCVSNMQMERLASSHGPTNGTISRPSDGKAPKRVAFVQCAGSRDENNLSFCSYICCMASLKQATYVREQLPDTQVTIYYIDLRTPDRYQKFRDRVLSDEGIHAIKGKVADAQKGENGTVVLTVEDAVAGTKSKEEYDLVVLATGMQPTLAGEKLPFDLPLDEEGFIVGGEDNGIFAAGCAKKPLDVMKSAQSGTGAAMKAIETVRGR